MWQSRLLCRMLLLFTLIFLLSFSVSASTTSAATTPLLIISSPGGDGGFTLEATGLRAVSGLYVSISYDSSTLQAPRVSFGSLAAGKLNTVSTGNPIRIAVVDPSGMNGHGTIATIQFDRVGASLGVITSLTAKLVDPQSHEIAIAKPLVLNPFPPQASGNDSGSGTATRMTGAAVTGTSRTPVLGGSVTLPADEASGSRKKEEGSQTPPQEKREEDLPQAPVAPAAAAAATGEPGPAAAQPPASPPQRVPSVLERFRMFRGEKTPSALTALFNSESGRCFWQSPAIAVSDGESTVALAISNVPEEKVPTFTFDRARFVSLSHSYAGEWELEVRPEKGTLDCGVSMWLQGSRQDFPITVVPKADVGLTKSAQVAEADFLLFLHEQGTPSAPKYDLNGDGKRDYLDDYIFTANYLLKLDEQEKKTARQK